MNLEFYNCPKPQDFDPSVLPKDVGSALYSSSASSLGFLSYRPDFKAMGEFAGAYGHYQNILIIGHGGSITSFYGIYGSLKHQLVNAGKKVFFLSTIDPDYISEIKQQLSPSNTLVIAISKSGENITQLEMLSQFLEFPVLVITGKSSPLRAMAEKLKFKIILHPTIGGRYTGLTEVALLPAVLCGIDVQKLFKGAENFYNTFYKNNLAWQMASVLYQLEEKGIVDVFMPFYSHSLFAFSNLIVQLCHESFGKEGIGQTYFAHEAPESQHHTNQRFFGGRKNICGFFISQQNFSSNALAVYPPTIHSVQIKNHPLFDINKIPLAESIKAELNGTMEDARINGIPSLHLSIDSINEEVVGEFLAFWQIFAVYSSVLRGVDPFDQPQVENSKNISFSKRLQFKGLL